MSELLVAPRPNSCETLYSRAAQLAREVAAVIERIGSAVADVPETVTFLRDWADTVDDRYEFDLQPLDHLADRFDLSPVECDLLVLAGLPEVHEGVAGAFRAMNPNEEPWPTVGIAAVVLDDRANRSAVLDMLCAGPLIRYGLVQLSGKGPIFEQSMQPAERLWVALAGHDGWPDVLQRVHIGDVPSGLSHWVRTVPAQQAVRALASDEPRTLLVQSHDIDIALGRCAVLAEAAAIGMVGARLAPDDRHAIGLLAAHAAARNAVPLVVVESSDQVHTSWLSADDLAGPLVVCMAAGSARLSAHRPVMTVPIGPITPDDRRDAWSSVLPDLAEDSENLAVQHPLDPALTAQVARDARALSLLGAQTFDKSAISALIRARAAAVLPAGIDLVSPTADWSRLVVPAKAETQLREAVARLTHQARVLGDWQMLERARASSGARVLLTGPPGTGKTLAAEAVATAAGTDLLRVDTSQVVSKWIGETEKNLAAAFDVAERTQAVLFMDEADAIFGARTEITDAHDRYANLETAYLLQRLDRFDGLLVLATNLRNNIDAAFLRRMDFVVDLPMPDVESRRKLWQLHLPSRQLHVDIDLHTLVHMYPIPGAWIRNAAIGAAFRAAASDCAIRQDDLIMSIRIEYEKSALPFPGAPPRRRNDL
jgi:hypothetical protein